MRLVFPCLALALACAVPRPARADGTSAAAQGDRQGDMQAIRNCIELWGAQHPFTSSRNALPPYKVLASTVRVMGFNDEVTDREQTSKPALILVKAAAPNLAHTRLRLLNANGWYCLKTKDGGQRPQRVELACNARLVEAQKAAGVLPLDRPGCENSKSVLLP